ncbi:MAG: flavodoxin domain-containing protein, partial [Candidatus Thermoplasmatota archaeon]|nr:flavodoxin domain-containing protein [Candidatus Thermoplasmatota archaeon]
ACEQAAPEVFEVTEDTCFIKSDVRLDGGFDRNDSKSALKEEVIQTLSDDIFDAADGCPVDVIIVVEAQADEEEKEADAPVVEVEAPVDADPADEPLVVEGLDAFLTTGDRTLNVFFGSQSGNSEELAAKLAKNASQYGLEGVVHDMDGFDINSMASMKRVAIVCSTWGEGEMPDNAEALWQAAASDGAPRMDGMSFSVLALGDTSYELFCQSGKDWDNRLEELGANRVVKRVDCDVDYEAPASLWAEEALTMLSAIDDSGNLHEELIDAIRDLVSGGVSAAEGEDGFTLPDLSAGEIEAQLSVFRYDPHEKTSGTDTWLCSLNGHTTLMDALRSIQRTHDGSLCFTDGSPHDPCTALLVNGRVTLPGSTRMDRLSNGRPGPVMLTIEPLPGYDVLRDLCVDFDSLLKKRETASVWHVSRTR